ncbi:MAG: winged helix-turn-helix domain-containing tetratricopeptide repeat protein [Thermoanaerobaculia bacterium]
MKTWPGDVVSRDELLHEVWGGRAVTDHVLTRAVGQLRSALGDDPHDPRVIETIARRGYRLLAPVEPVAGGRSESGRGFRSYPRARGWWAVLALAAVALLTTWALWRPSRAAPLPVRAVTVLPFQVLSPNDSAAPISEGMVEILVSDLSRIEGLRVIARRSAFSRALEGLSLEQIGTRLGVDAVVQGSVHGQEDSLRVDIRLVRTHDGQVLWSGVVRGDGGDLLALHEQAAEAVTAAVRGSPLPARGPMATINRDAYREYLFGRHHWNRRTVDGLQKAIAHFEAALQLDPRYAQAHAASAQTHVLLPYYGVAAPREAMPRARRAAERALELDPRLASAHAVLGQILHEYEWALELDPLSPIVSLLAAGPPLLEGHCEEAATAIRRVLELEPRFAQGPNLLALSLLWGGHPGEAIAEFETALPDFGVGLIGPRLGYAYAVLGRFRSPAPPRRPA